MPIVDGDLKYLDYNNIYLVPQKTIVSSRSECDTSVELGGRKFSIPIYPANMKSVVNAHTCKFLSNAKNNMFYTMHRFGVDIVDFVNFMHSNDSFASISIGVKKDSYDSLQSLLDNNLCPEYITLDIANAWSKNAKEVIEYINNKFPKSNLIVGNIATPEACRDISSWGEILALKCGIAGGKTCITKNKTGFHIPMVNTVEACSHECHKNGVKCIADGGIEGHGDIAKAIALGADMVMAGYLFSGYNESAGEIVTIDGHMKKEYFGSASAENKGLYKNVEGKKILVDYRGKMSRLIHELKEDLQSAISYSGGKTIQDLKNTPYIVKF